MKALLVVVLMGSLLGIGWAALQVYHAKHGIGKREDSDERE